MVEYNVTYNGRFPYFQVGDGRSVPRVRYMRGVEGFVTTEVFGAQYRTVLERFIRRALLNPDFALVPPEPLPGPPFGGGPSKPGNGPKKKKKKKAEGEAD